MFIHKNQLRYLLAPSCYFSPEHYERELQNLFVPGWHFAASVDELPDSGDFVTMELLGQPLLLRNFEGTILAFLNVCPHRHCLLTSEARGSSPQLRCQYHGWEFGREGQTGRIPDAPSFRPFDRENSRLQPVRSAACGKMVFVCLAPDGPSLEEYLGDQFSLLRNLFSPDFRQLAKWEFAYSANWKVPVENSLESYHVPCLHSKSLGDLPDEDRCEHELHPTHTIFRTPWKDTREERIIRYLGMPTSGVYTHYHFHPNLVVTTNDAQRFAQLFVPTSSTTTAHRMWLFGARGQKHDPLAVVLSWLVARTVKRLARQIVQEDVPIFADVQRGLVSSPFSGAIGTREERIHVFQEYVLGKCGLLK